MLCPSCGANVPQGAVACGQCGRAVAPTAVSTVATGTQALSPEAAEFAGKKIPAAVCGILLGSIGVHKFVIGRTTPGIIMLLTTILTLGFGSLIMGPIGLIEGIIYLTKSDAEFYRQYAVEKKGWF